jgi:plastocyanin
MTRLRASLIVLMAVAAFVLLATPALAATASVKMTESSERYHFTPPSVSVSVGDSVTWENTTDATHTVTSDDGTELDSGSVTDGKTFKHTFSTAGTFSYHCSIHPYMTGTVIVLTAASTPPATDTDASTSPSTAPVLLILLAALAPAVLLARRLRRQNRS